MSVTFYASPRIGRLKTLPEMLKAETVNGIRRGQSRIRRKAAEGVRERGIGRAVFFKKISGVYKNIKREKVIERGGVFSAGLTVNGIAAIQDRGGQIKAHSIGTGRMHPGANMPAFPYLDRAVSGSRSAFSEEIKKGVDRAVDRVSRG